MPIESRCNPAGRVNSNYKECGGNIHSGLTSIRSKNYYNKKFSKSEEAEMPPCV